VREGRESNEKRTEKERRRKRQRSGKAFLICPTQTFPSAKFPCSPISGTGDHLTRVATTTYCCREFLQIVLGPWRTCPGHIQLSISPQGGLRKSWLNKCRREER
jgi:hypothetical protein